MGEKIAMAGNCGDTYTRSFDDDRSLIAVIIASNVCTCNETTLLDCNNVSATFDQQL